MDNGKINSAARSSTSLVQRLRADELPGWWGKILHLRPGQQAVVVRGGGIDVLSPPRHRVAGLFGGAPDDLALVRTTPFTLHPLVDGLLSGDGQPLAADFLVRVRVADPERAYHFLGAERDRLATGDLSGQVAGEVGNTLAYAARQHTADDLCSAQLVSARLAGELRGFLANYLESWGLEVQQVANLVFLRAEDHLRRTEAINRLRARLRQADLRERLSAIRDETEFAAAIKRLEHEEALGDALRQEEIDELKREVVESAAGPPSDGSARLLDLLDGKLAGFQEQLIGRFEGMLKNLGYEEPAAAPATIANLGRWVTGLRALGGLVIVATTLLALYAPDLFSDVRLPQMITSIVGGIVALLAFASAFWIEGRSRGQREVRRAQAEQSRLGAQRRQAAERMVRARVLGVLEKVESVLQESWTRAYRGPHQSLAVPLRRLARSAGELRQEVGAANYHASALLTRVDISPVDVQAIIQLDESLLRQGQYLAEASEELHSHVLNGEATAIESGASALEQGLRDLRSRLIERDALLKGV